MKDYVGKIALFAGGILFGTAGLKILGSDDLKKGYTHAVAAGLRAKDTVVDTSTKVKLNCDDILADAKSINEKRAEEKAAGIIEDAEEIIVDAAEIAEEAKEAADEVK